MARKRRKAKPAADWLWHEEMMREPHLSYHGSTERQWERWLEGNRQQMAAYDSQPPRMRELVAEHNNTKAMEIYRAEVLARPRCPHGRQADICAQCLWQKHENEQRERARDGSELKRQASGDRASATLERARRRGHV